MNYKVNYFDGKSSKTHNAIVQPNDLGWTILFKDEFNQEKNIFWKIDSIKKSEVYTKNLVSFSYGDSFPFQKIESSDNNFIQYIKENTNKNINNKFDNWLHNHPMKSIFYMLLIVIGFSLTMYFYVIPNIAVSFAKNLPKDYVVNFGDYVYRVLYPKLTIDEKQTKNLQNFVDQLKLDNEFPLTVYVSKTDQVNAFALSGGKFVIFTGLLNKIENEHQLAALIGHEVSHIENRHVLKNVARNLSSAIFMSILFGDVSAATSILTENANQIFQLSYSRSLEKEADTKGLEILKNNSLDQHGMIQLFKILKNESSIKLPEFLSSHPILDERIEYSKNIAEQQQQYTENKILKEKWNVIKAYFYNTEKQTNAKNE